MGRSGGKCLVNEWFCIFGQIVVKCGVYRVSLQIVNEEVKYGYFFSSLVSGYTVRFMVWIFEFQCWNKLLDA